MQLWVDGKYPLSPPIRPATPSSFLVRISPTPTPALLAPTAVAAASARRASPTGSIKTASHAAGSAADPTFGNSRRNILDAPGQSNTDLAVLRHFNMFDKADMEFRANSSMPGITPYFAPPGNNISSPPTLGKITQR